jgi:hypothetical protein
MSNIVSPSAHLQDIEAVDLVERAKRAYAALRAADGDALDHAFNLGDAAIQIGDSAPKRGRQRHLVETIGAPKTTINECIRLAMNRMIIEATFDLDGAPSRSILAALRLLRATKGTEGKAKSTRKTKQQPALPALLEKASADEILAALSKVKRGKIVDRVIGLHRRGGLDSPATKLFRAALSLVQVEKPDSSQIIGVLRAILRKHNPSHLEIVEVVSAQERAAA